MTDPKTPKPPTALDLIVCSVFIMLAILCGAGAVIVWMIVR